MDSEIITTALDPSLASNPTDGELAALQKINNLFTLLSVTPDPNLASNPTDNQIASAQKLNQLLYNQAVALSNWQTPPTFINGSSDPNNPVQFRYEPSGIVRLRGIFIANAADGSSKISGLPAALNQTATFAQAGRGSKGAICLWCMELVNQVLSFGLFLPSSETSGNCGLNGITYTYQ